MKNKRLTKSKPIKHKCGLCGKTTNLIKTECCGNWICNDEHKYKAFSYSRNSCMRNHSRYTLCAFHHSEQHKGDWQTCQECRDAFDTEMYVYYGTNDYNFIKLQNPPKYELIKCSECGVSINRTQGGYSSLGGKNWCNECTQNRFRKP